jgi:ArsR family transcriptional regulator, arsenate/arsenite/antimonite-responsive transcriptional repressor
METFEDKVVKIAKALSDKTRIKILKEVAKKGSIGLTCGDAEQIAELSQPTVSHHIKVLAEADLLNAEKDGRCVRISVNNKTLNEFSSLILASFKDS